MKRTSSSFYSIGCNLVLFLSAIILTASIVTAADIPYLTGRVTDNAQILSQETRQSLTESLKAHEGRTGNQIAVLTTPTLDGESIEDYATKVFEAWKLGQKGKDNDLLIIVVSNDRRMRIEVGYGLEGTMTDLMAGRIIQHVMTPKFKNGDYDGGITDGTRTIMEVLEGDKLPDRIGDEDGVTEKSNFFDSKGPDMPIAERILFGAFIFGIIGLFTIIGIITPDVGWFLYLFLIPFWAMFPIVILGVRGALIRLVTYLIIFPVAKLILRYSNWYQKAKNDMLTKGKASIGGFTFGSGGSGKSWSSGGSSFSSGSSFSGGGGSSGSW